jgi:glycosyltransferase involved in cell wall biosynthesis
VKIAIWHNLPSGGAKRLLYYEARELARRGHTIEAWCPPTADRAYLPIGEFASEHVLPLRWNDRPRGRLARVAWPYYSVVGKLAAMDEHCRRCAEAIERGGFDILYAHGCMFFRVTAISRYVRIPKVISLGEPYRWLYEALPRLPWLALPSERRWWSPARLRARLIDGLRLRALRIQAREELLNAQAYDSLLVYSFYSRESMLRAYGIDAKVRYPGVDLDQFVWRDQPRENLVVGIGAFVPEKNVRFVIEALATMPPPRPRLVWLGNVASPAYLDELRRLAAALDVAFEPRVGVADDEVLDLLNRALSMAYAPRLEPFGLAPLEAGACGLPVVAVAEGGVRETVVDGVSGLLVEHDPQAMARAIVRLRDDPALARRLGEGGHGLVHEKWSLGASIDRLEQRFAEALKRPSGRL